MAENKPSSGQSNGKAKKFLASKLFKFILIIALEVISLAIFTLVMSKTNGADVARMKFPTAVLVYWGICAVFAIPKGFRVAHAISTFMNAPPSQRKNVIRIMSESEYYREQRDREVTTPLFSLIMAIILPALFAPFIAPLGLADIIHKIIRNFVK